MKFIIDGNYNKELIPLLKSEELPVSHILVHTPDNPLGNGSVFLPERMPSFEEFKSYTKLIKKFDFIPIAGMDSTCQGNLEAHMQQHKAINSFFDTLIDLGYNDFLISSPNNIGYIKANYPSMKVFLSYSQYTTSLNRSKIFFDMGADYITLHPDIIRSFPALENLIKLKEKIENDRIVDYILPLNLGCNWGCIYWYQHHNLQSHRTIKSPVFPDQQKFSDIDDEFDYPMLNCWKERLNNPANVLKSGWISPYNIDSYSDIGYDNYLLFTQGFSTQKIIKILNYYLKGSFNDDFFEILNIPHPYGNYWSKEKVKTAMGNFPAAATKQFCESYPYQESYPFEKEINSYCKSKAKEFLAQNDKERQEIVDLIDEKLEEIEKGAVNL
jgi:hypothetical protein